MVAERGHAHDGGEQPGHCDAVGSRRTAWRIIARVEQPEKILSNEQRTESARQHIAEVEAGLQKAYGGILAMMDKNLIPSASTGESKEFYYKVKGDYCRYLACDAKSKAA